MQDIAFRQFVERVKLAVSIEDVVRRRVPELKRAGATWKACCPFHEERTPSFHVNPARGTWHCFGSCSEGGDAIDFVARFDGVAFLEALESLASEVGLEMPERGRDRSRDAQRHAPLLAALEFAAGFYRRKLGGPEGEAARRYLAERGVSAESAEAFALGWAPAQGQPLFDAARAAGIGPEALLAAGLVRRRDDGSAYDFFRGRLMIPIRDLDGRVVGFGGRVLPGADRAAPKYVNTPETPVFHKGRLIYGLDRALVHARRTRHLLLVEGYTDVIGLHQAGIGQACAVLGTATTPEHAGLVRRTGARRVSLVFDGDEAGRRAAARALVGLLPKATFEIDVVPMPQGEDPADLVAREGRAGFEARLERPTPWFDFLVQGLLGLEPGPLAEAVDQVFDVLEALRLPVEREARVGELATRLGLPEEAVRDQWRARRGRRPGAVAQAAPRGDAAGAAGNTGGPGTVPMGSGSGAAPVGATVRGAGTPAGAEGDPRHGSEAPQVRRAFGELLAAALLDNGMIAAHRPWFELGAIGPDSAPTGETGAFAAPPRGLLGELLRSARLDALLPAEEHAPAREAGALPADLDSWIELSARVVPRSADAHLIRLTTLLLALYDEDRVDAEGEDLPVDLGALLDALGDDPARGLATRLEQHARRASSVLVLAEGAARRLSEILRRRLRSALEARVLADAPSPEVAESRRLELASLWMRPYGSSRGPAALSARPAGSGRGSDSRGADRSAVLTGAAPGEADLDEVPF